MDSVQPSLGCRAARKKRNTGSEDSLGGRRIGIGPSQPGNAAVSVIFQRQFTGRDDRGPAGVYVPSPTIAMFEGRVMLKDVRIGKKLGIGFGVATALLVVVSAVATIGLIKASERLRSLSRNGPRCRPIGSGPGQSARGASRRQEVHTERRSRIDRRIQRAPRKGRGVLCGGRQAIDRAAGARQAR